MCGTKISTLKCLTQLRMKNEDSLFGLKPQNDDLYGHTYIKELDVTKHLSAAKIFGNIKRSCNKLRGTFNTHVNGVPVFSTTQRKKTKEQGVAEDFSFEITFAREAQLKEKKLK